MSSTNYNISAACVICASPRKRPAPDQRRNVHGSQRPTVLGRPGLPWSPFLARCPGTSTIQRCMSWSPSVDASKRINDDMESRLLPDGIAKDPGPSTFPAHRDGVGLLTSGRPRSEDGICRAQHRSQMGVDLIHATSIVYAERCLPRCLVTSLLTAAGNIF